MVRADFWMAATHCMRALEVRLVEAENSAAVDLFPERHARKVLAAFGRAFGTLPESISDVNKEQKTFLKQSVAGLTEEGNVICVRLALFAEMMKGMSWTPNTLETVGGTKGVGVTFLEKTFSAIWKSLGLKSGHIFLVKYNSAYDNCQSIKLDNRYSPLVRMNKSGSGIPPVSSKLEMNYSSI